MTVRYAIATPHAAATAAGREAFEAGGNAVDAALSAAVTLTVAYPHMCSPGGDLVALVARPDGGVVGVNGTGAAPAGAAVGRGGSMPRRGPKTVTVPGVVAGWESVHDLGGRLAWRSLFDRAGELARDGVALAPDLRAAIDGHRAELAADPGMAAVFLGAGRVLRQPALARSLATLAEDGPPALYGGAVGDQLVRGLQEVGVPISLADLAAHRSELVEPLGGAFAGEEVLTTPPNTQGFVLLEMLAGLSPLQATPAELARRFAAAAAVRDRTLGDPRRGSGDTVAVVAADAEGWVVSLIQSTYFAFGAGILEPDTGISMHNRGAAFSLDPDSPALLVPGRRPPHTLMPVLTRRDGRITGAHGTMGGHAQPLIHAQLLARVAAGADPQAAVAAPRCVVEGSYALAEPGIDARELGRVGFDVQRLDAPGHACGHAMIVRDLEAGSDPRADGSVACGSLDTG